MSENRRYACQTNAVPTTAMVGSLEGLRPLDVAAAGILRPRAPQSARSSTCKSP